MSSPRQPDGLKDGSLLKHTATAGEAERDDVENGIIESYGYEQSYRRVFHTIGNVALTLSLASPMGAILVIASYQILYAGYWGMTWGWIIPSVLFLPQAMAVAELASAMPVNGAFYWWVSALAPPSTARGLSFVTGIANVLVIFTSLGSFSYASGSSLATVITFLHPEWIPTNAHMMAISMGVIAIWLTLSLLKMERIQWVFFASSAIVLVTTAVFIIALPTAHASRGLPFTSASKVFGSYHNYSDWDRAVAVPMSFFSVAWVVTGWASPAYVAEETHDAQRAIPKAIVSSYVLTAAMGAGVCIILAFCITDMDSAAADPTGLPMYTLLSQRWGARISASFFLVISSNTFLGGSSLLVASASQLAAFARDGGLPFGKRISHVHPRTNVPILAACVLATGGMLILLLALSPAARTIIYSLAVICGLVLYALPISLRLMAGSRFVQGPWNYGRFSFALHAYALLSLVWLIIMESFPATASWTASTFNYSWVLTVGLFAVAVVWYKVSPGTYQPILLAGTHTRRDGHEAGTEQD